MGEGGNNNETRAPKLEIIVSPNTEQPIDLEYNGEVAERLNAPVLKTGVLATVP
jgi:hypothetical protein